ncbi:MAG: Mur ligase family protein, partial [Bacteroidota bacterium]
MNYSEALDFLYSQMPVFQHKGKAAYKPGLERIQRLCTYLGEPQNSFKSIHIAGTNGKGSSAHMIASVLQSVGYQVGLHTSPHLYEFTERLRVNGQEAEKEWVAEFVTKHQPFLEELGGSFFEIIVGMTFQYFVERKVEWAVVEVGLGGRLDATNILSPEICLITHIGRDHEAILGDTLPKIATEKAGIMKVQTPVVRGERQAEIEGVFKEIAQAQNAELFYPESTTKLETDLKGAYQKQNLSGVLKTLEILEERGKVTISDEALKEGLLKVKKQTGLRG